MASKGTNSTFIEKAILLHGNRYSYDLVDYKNNRDKIKIICAEHGIFEQRPDNHLGGSGCPSCSSNIRYTTKTFIAKAKEVHGDNYSYELVNYKNILTKIKITCLEHGIFEQTPHDHLSACGCPICGVKNKGWTKTAFKERCKINNDSLGIFYVLGCWNEDRSEVFVKIGITSRSIKKRYNSKTLMPYNYKVLHEITGSADYIYDLENLVLKNSVNFAYKPKILFGGYATECFSADKIYLDNLNKFIFNLVPF